MLSLSKENLEKINFNGLYKHEPDKRYSKHEDLYWCQNWTFRPQKYKYKVYMRDTYWGDDGLNIEVTDNNINEFELLFDFTDVKQIDVNNIEEYGEENKDWFIVAVDSGGISYPKQFIRKNAQRNKQKVINRKKKEINELERKIDDIKRFIEMLENGEIQPRDWM